MARIHVEPERLANDHVVLVEEDHRYLTRVLRLGVGEHVTLFDGMALEADAEVTRVGPRAVELKVTARRPVGVIVGPRITVVQGLPKGDKIELVIQKATELGAHRVLPVLTERAVARPEGIRAVARVDRWRKIAREAARQSGRADVPEIETVMQLGVALSAAPARALKLMLWEGAHVVGLGTALREARADAASRRSVGESADGAARSDVGWQPEEIVIVIGPEGGLADAEVQAGRDAGFSPVGLGPRILRTETAALAALAVIHHALGHYD